MGLPRLGISDIGFGIASIWDIGFGISDLFKTYFQIYIRERKVKGFKCQDIGSNRRHVGSGTKAWQARLRLN